MLETMIKEKKVMEIAEWVVAKNTKQRGFKTEAFAVIKETEKAYQVMFGYFMGNGTTTETMWVPKSTVTFRDLDLNENPLNAVKFIPDWDTAKNAWATEAKAYM